MKKQAYTPILATLGYVFNDDRSHVLMIHRNKNPNDLHFGKYNGLGGKLEPTEDVISGMRREIYEESGIIADELSLAGTVNWPGFGKNGEDWFGFIFLIHKFSGELKTECDEGSLLWVPRTEISSLSLWEGDTYFLPLVFAEPQRPFHAVMPYQDGHPLSWHVRFA